MISPGFFIPIAEETGLIVSIGEWVLRQACRDAKKWQDRYKLGLRVGVNLSALQLRQAGLADVVKRALEETGLEPALLELEVTESLNVKTIPNLIETLQALRDLGCSIAIDDFGTGQSSLDYLRRFPADRIKIDQVFVRNIGVDPDDEAIVKATIDMAKGLNRDVIAEGVEYEQHREFLRANGCHELQGYLFCRPLPAATFENLLNEREKAYRVAAPAGRMPSRARRPRTGGDRPVRRRTAGAAGIVPPRPPCGRPWPAPDRRRPSNFFPKPWSIAPARETRGTEADELSDLDTDLDLVNRVQKGDRRAFDILVRKYQHRVLGLIGRYISDWAEAQDVAQDAFIRAYRAIPNFRGESAFYTWLYKIAVNTAKNHLVSQRRRPQGADVELEDAVYLESASRLKDSSTPERELLRQEIEQNVFAAVESLPEDLRMAITLREVDGLSYEQIAEVMNCPIGTVRSRIFRARDAIDQRIRPLVGSPEPELDHD
jgi:RNA polymerase sigma factor RpoE